MKKISLAVLLGAFASAAYAAGRGGAGHSSGGSMTGSHGGSSGGVSSGGALGKHKVWSFTSKQEISHAKGSSPVAGGGPTGGTTTASAGGSGGAGPNYGFGRPLKAKHASKLKPLNGP